MKKLLTAIVLSVCSILSNAQPTVSLTDEDKLSNNTVSSFCEDALGRIWIATKSGVDRFDGYDVDVFYHDPLNDGSIQSNLVNKVYRDWNDNIWICNANGLAYYDCESDCIRRIAIPLKSVENIIQVSPDRLLICSQSVSVLYDCRTGACEPFEPGGAPFVFYNAHPCDGYVIFCTSAYNLDFITFAADGSWARKAEPIHFAQSVHGALFDSDGNLWTDAFGKGLWKIDPATFEKTLIKVAGLPSERIECICSDSEGCIWLGTKRGLCIYDPVSGSSRSHNAAGGFIRSENLDIRTFFKDSGSNIWIGTSFNGAICRLSDRKPFSTIALPGANSGKNTVTSLGADTESGVLWVGTQQGGVYRVPLSENLPEPASDIRMANSICLHPSYPQSVFVSSFVDGIYSVHKVSGRSRLVWRHHDISLIAPAARGRIWAGSLSGLYIVDPSSGTAANPGLFPENSRQSVTALLTDSDGFLWVGCREGLYRCRVSDSFSLTDESYPGMSDIMRVQALIQASDGKIWIGTSDGLLSFADGELGGFVPEPMLMGRSIMGMREGGSGGLWITTDRGLFHYNHIDGSCQAFYASDGLQSNYFTAGSITECAGDFFVGGRIGISYFTPSQMSEDTVTVAPFVSNLLVHNVPVRPGDGSGILEEPVGRARNIVLRHNQNAFSFHFTCPDFAACGNNLFWCKMEGFDEGWILSENRTATYTNLPKGEYVFRVRAANTSGVVCPEEVAINIRVKPVWYKTDAFLVFLILVFALALSRFVLFIIGRANAANERRMSALKVDYEERLRRSKLREYIIPGYVPTADEEKMILKFIGKIEDDISNPSLSVESLASYMCMSRCNLHLKIKNLTGSSPIDLLKKIRIEKACELLRQGNLSIADISERAGFATASYFCSAFKKATGHTPKEYASRK